MASTITVPLEITKLLGLAPESSVAEAVAIIKDLLATEPVEAPTGDTLSMLSERELRMCAEMKQNPNDYARRKLARKAT